MTISVRTHVLSCVLAGLITHTPCVLAQDPAAVGNHYDPAFVGSHRMPPRQAPPESVPPPGGNIHQFDSIADVEALSKQIRTQLDDSSGYADVFGSDDALRYRSDVEALVRKHWNTLSPQTRDLYASQFGRAQPGEAATSARIPYTDTGPERTELLRGLEDPRDALRDLESLLVPMLQDLKQGTNATLQQNANRR